MTPRTRAIVPVHFAGRPCDMDAIVALARRTSLIVIEDCAHAIETLYRGRHAGTFGDARRLQLLRDEERRHRRGRDGDDARDESLAARLKVLALHGLSADAWKRFSDEGYQHYEVVEPGFKYNMTDLQAALGIHQLARVEQNLQRRQEIWRRYDEAFADLPVTTPAPEEPDTRHARHLYTVLLRLEDLGIDRDGVLAALHRQNIGTGVHYRGVHLHEYYRERFGYTPEDFPVATDISARTISLPLSPKLTDVDVDDVILGLRRVLEHYAR